MDFVEIVGSLQQMMYELMPVLRALWIAEIVLGAILIAAALVLKRNPERKKTPIVLGVIGGVMMLSAIAQLITSFN